MLGANAHAAVPSEYSAIVSSSVLGAPERVGEAAEHDAADRPAEQQHADRAPVQNSDTCLGLRRAERDAEQRRARRRARRS
jgi:hypothetical protein